VKDFKYRRLCDLLRKRLEPFNVAVTTRLKGSTDEVVYVGYNKPTGLYVEVVADWQTVEFSPLGLDRLAQTYAQYMLDSLIRYTDTPSQSQSTEPHEDDDDGTDDPPPSAV
jgi:hypothetical protein